MKLSCSQFAKHALGVELWDKQQEILDNLFENNINHAIWALGRRCVTADTLVATGRGLIEIGSIAGQGEGLGNGWEQSDLLVAQPTGQARNAAMFYTGGIQDIIRIRTSRGFEVAGTPNHPVMVMNKEGNHRWRPLGKIKRDDQIVIRAGANTWPEENPSIAPIAAKHVEAALNNIAAKTISPPSVVTEDFAYALGVLVGDGSWTVDSGVNVTSHEDDVMLVRDFLHRGLGVELKVSRDTRRPSTCSLKYFSKYYRAFLDDLGWHTNVIRDQKRVPWVIMQSRKEIVCSFLSGLFDTDGTVDKKGQTISFSTACLQLGREVHMLLLNLGILSKLSCQKVNGKDYWNVTLLGLESRDLFCSLVGFRLPRKQFRAVNGLNVSRDGGNTGAIPHQKSKLKQLVCEFEGTRGDGIISQLRLLIGNCLKNTIEEFNARRLPGIIKLIDDHRANGDAANHFRDLASSHFFYDPVVEVSNEHPQEVFDFHVPEGNAFIANGIVNHNSGKTFMSAVAAVYMCFVQDEFFIKKVRKGEKWYIIAVANDLGQSKIALDNIRQLILNSPFRQEITRETSLDIEISNGCVFQAIPASARASRGKAVVAILQDELAFSIEGDMNRGAEAMYNALSPSIAQFGKYGKIIELSSPWLTSGLFFDHFKQAESGDFPGMEARQIPTWEINPSLPYGCDFLERARKKDEETFQIEFGAQFRRSNSVLIAPEIVDIAVNKERNVLLPIRDYMGTYVLALDPARGGAGRDSYVACIVHYEGEQLVVDKFHTFDADFEIAGKKEVNIAQVELWIEEHHRIYDFQSIILDQYNSAGTIQNLSKNYPIAELTWSVSTKMKAFNKMKELFNAGLIELPNHKEAIKQLKNLSVIYRNSGQWSVTGGKESSVDDLAFALAGAILEASKDSDVDWINSLIH